MILGIPKETLPGERRVACAPNVVAALQKTGCSILLESGAGDAAGFPDSDYKEKNVDIASSRSDVFARADIVVQVRTLGANPEHGKGDLALLRTGQVLIGMSDPLSEPEANGQLAKTGVTLLSMELVPRITRAQSMDVLSSQATVAGYAAVLQAATTLPKMFPMFMTAAGTITPARVFVIGAGVAGLQAISTARRLGAVVQSYDVRPAVREQVESLGAKFVELPLETQETEDKGGYAKAQGEEFLRKQRELMKKVVQDSDVVITTAAIPGKKSPVLVTEDMVKGMRPGGVIVDLAAERGGNCDLTEADKTVVKHGVTIMGPTNLASSAPFHASQMYAKNVANLMALLVKDGQFNLDMEDEIVREILVAQGGEVRNERVKQALSPVSAG